MYQYSNKSSRHDSKIKNKFLLTALVSIIPFLIVVVVTIFGWEKLTDFDYQLSQYFYALHKPLTNGIMTVITHLGDIISQTVVTVATVIVLFLLKKWRTALWYGITVLFGALLLNGAIKEFYARARPSQIDPLVEIGGYSFPSGHSMGAMIVYGGLLFLILSSIHSLYLKIILTTVFFITILAIGLSRIYLAVHFPSDVIAGFSLGLSWLSLSIAVFGIKYRDREFRLTNQYSIKSL